MTDDQTFQDPRRASRDDRIASDRHEATSSVLFGTDGALDRMLQSFDDWLKRHDAAPRLA